VRLNNPDYLNRIEKAFEIKFNKNQRREIERLAYEISINSDKTADEITKILKDKIESRKTQAKDTFYHIKRALIALRYPETQTKQKIEFKDLYLNPLKGPAKNTTYHPLKEFYPERIIVEKEAVGSHLDNRAKEYYPDIKIEYIERASQFLNDYKVTPENLKRPLLFIVKEKRDFIKPCPCTKNHLGCGYWILNAGFGCPYDCSYCYLQQYQNFPGITLPSDLDGFFLNFETFFKKINRPIRIGTGEFCDSLALDDLTLYSEKLIGFFSKKDVLFELKTKSANIKNILKSKPAKNIIISWSLMPQPIISSEEYAVSELNSRIESALKVQKHGFSIAFHFDPIIYYPGWEKGYTKLIEQIYSLISPPLAWISLGTLRFNRELKPVIEKRFPESRIVYGELLIGKDKKLRYPEFLRKDIYQKVFRQIRKYDKITPVYLCMESKEIWRETIQEVRDTKEIEKSLIENNPACY